MANRVTRFPALGTTAVLLVADERARGTALRILERELGEIDASCSRFRDDSDLMRVNAASGQWVRVGARCIEAIEVALRAALATDGLVDPTIGRSLRVLGYDRDFADVTPTGPRLRVTTTTVPGWATVEIDHAAQAVRVAKGVELDLGATAKALCADRAARGASEATGIGVVVALGGDVAIAGPAPADGWPIRVADDHEATSGGQTVALYDGGLATSGTARRAWTRGNQRLHHLIDPRTGAPAADRWRTVSVAAASCVDANIASTAAVVMSGDAPDWLAARRLPARLTAHDGAVIVVGGWPTASDARTDAIGAMC